MNDFTAENLGTVWLFTAQSPEAREEMDQMGLEPWQQLGQWSFGVDHRVAHDLVGQLHENGFSVGDGS